MKIPVRCLCFLIAVINCAAYWNFEAYEKIKSPEACEITDSRFAYETEMKCPNFTMTLDRAPDLHNDGEEFLEYRSLIKCSPEYMPYKYLPHMQSNRNSLTLENCQPPPANASFGNGWPELQLLHFENYGDIEPLKREHFSGLNNLWSLKLFINSSHDMPDDLLSDLKKLEYLNMHVLQVNKKIFTNLTELETLQLTIDSLENMNDFDTSSLKNSRSFKTLNLYSNSFTRLTKQFFEGCQNVENLSIRNSKIDAIDADAFEPMTNLRSLIMTYNDLTSLPAGLFSQNKKLENVHILFSEKLTSVPPGLFSHLPNLREISIACKLSSIPNDLIEGSTNLELLNLQFNGLTSLPRDLLRNHSNLRHIRLYGNILNSTSTDLFDGKSPLTQVTFVLNYNVY